MNDRAWDGLQGMAHPDHEAAIGRVAVLVGRWSVEAPGLGDAVGTMTIEPVLAGTHYLQRTSIPVPGAPEALSVLAFDDVRGTLVQHYFDDRGVSRRYDMALDDVRWTLSRDAPDVTPLPFRQRFTGRFDDGGTTIRGMWERTDPDPDGPWLKDFELLYRRQA